MLPCNAPRPCTVDGRYYDTPWEAASAEGLPAAAVLEAASTGPADIGGKLVEPVRREPPAGLRRGHRPKPCVVDGVRYDGVAEAARALGLAPNQLGRALGYGLPRYKGHSIGYHPDAFLHGLGAGVDACGPSGSRGSEIVEKGQAPGERGSRVQRG